MPDKKIVNVKNDAIAKAISDKSIADSVFKKISKLESEGGLNLPKNYSPGNALKSAWLIFQDDPKLMRCTEASKANALLDMVIQGLSPAKNQCYFIPYGNVAKMQRSYLGNVAVTKSLPEVKDARAFVIYEGEIEHDMFAFSLDAETMQFKIIKHEKDFRYIDPDKVAGVYSVIYKTDGTVDV